jgi:hypothetical protein
MCIVELILSFLVIIDNKIDNYNEMKVKGSVGPLGVDLSTANTPRAQHPPITTPTPVNSAPPHSTNNTNSALTTFSSPFPAAPDCISTNVSYPVVYCERLFLILSHYASLIVFLTEYGCRVVEVSTVIIFFYEKSVFYLYSAIYISTSIYSHVPLYVF